MSSRLVGAVRRLEVVEREKTRESRDRGRLFTVWWTAYAVRVVAADLKPGERIAIDVGQGKTHAQAGWRRITERVTTDPEDLGVLYGDGGQRLGTAISMTPDLVTYETAEGLVEVRCDPVEVAGGAGPGGAAE